MRQLDSRIKNIQKQVKPPNKPHYKCYLSDGTTTTMNVWEVVNFNKYDNDFLLYEPYIFKVEYIYGKEIAPKLCSIAEQIVEHAARKAEKGELHNSNKEL